MTAQPPIDRRLEHWTAVARPASLAMDDAHAAAALVGRLREEIAERLARLILGHAMQVDLFAHGVLAAPKAPERRFGDALAPEGELVPGLDVEVHRVEGEQFGEYPCLVGPA